MSNEGECHGGMRLRIGFRERRSGGLLCQSVLGFGVNGFDFGAPRTVGIELQIGLQIGDDGGRVVLVLMDLREQEIADSECRPDFDGSLKLYDAASRRAR
jgi:hypothetical protein